MTTKQSNVKQERAQNTNDNYEDVKKDCGQCRQLMYIKWKCNTCSLDLCEPCKINHIKNKTSANHTVTALKQDDTKCQQHLSETVQMFCLDCQHLVCIKCISDNHKRHDFVDIPKMYVTKEKQIKEQIAKCKQILVDDTNALSSVKKYEDQYISAIDASKNEIKEHHKIMKSDMDFLTTELLDKMNTKQTENTPIFKQQSRTIEKKVEKLKAAINNAEHHLKSGNQLAVIKYVSVMEQILQQTKPSKAVNIEPPMFRPWKYDHESLRPLLGYIDDDNEKASDSLDTEAGRSNDKHAPPKTTYQVKIISNFDLEKQECIAATLDGNCWVKTDGYTVLMSPNGKIQSNIEPIRINNKMAVNGRGELIVPDHSKLNIHIYNSQGQYKHQLDCQNRYVFDQIETLSISVTNNGSALLHFYDGHGFQYICLDTINNRVLWFIDLKYGGYTSKYFLPRVKSRLKDNGDICFIMSTGEVIVCTPIFQTKFTYMGTVPQGQHTDTVSKSRQISSYKSLEVDTDGNILLGDVNNSTVELIDGEGNFIQYILTRKDRLQKPTAMSLRVPGLLWVYSEGNNKMFVVEYKK